MPHDRDQPPTTTRRRVLVGGALAAGAAVAPVPLLTRGALASTATTTAPATTTTAPPRAIAQVPSDEPLAIFARSICFGAAEVYRRVLAAEDGLPAELRPNLHQFELQHLEAADSWTALAGLRGDRTPSEVFIDPLRVAIITASTEEQRIRVLYDAEQQMVATMLSLLARVRSTDAATVVAGIVGSSGRRATVLGSQLGLDLDEIVPEVESTEGAIEVRS